MRQRFSKRSRRQGESSVADLQAQPFLEPARQALGQFPEIGWFADRPENATAAELAAMKNFVIGQCRDFRDGRLCARAI